jgi:hypothetical protein
MRTRRRRRTSPRDINVVFFFFLFFFFIDLFTPIPAGRGKRGEEGLGVFGRVKKCLPCCWF